jgi:hypothetical protein
MFEAVTSFLNNYKSKIRNPLMGTILSVWIFHNWRIVYALFNFDKDCTMQEKINFIQDYFSKKEFLTEFFTIILIAFAAIFITFILLALSRLLTDGYYKIVEPFIINLLDKKTIFTHLEKKILDSKINELNSNIDRLRDANSKIENHNISLVSRAEQSEKYHNKELSDLSELSIQANDDFKLLQNKSILANKVIGHFDEIINGLSEEMVNELITYIEHSENINVNEYKNFVGLKAELDKIGVLISVSGFDKKTKLGILFLEYYKSSKKRKKIY